MDTEWAMAEQEEQKPVRILGFVATQPVEPKKTKDESEKSFTGTHSITIHPSPKRIYADRAWHNQF